MCRPERPVEHPVVEDDESHNAEQVDEEDVGAVNGVLPVPDAHGAVGTQQDGRRLARPARVAAVRVEGQRQRMAAEMVEQKIGDARHGNGKDQQPAQPAHDGDGRREDAVEVHEEDDAADVPLAAAEQAPLGTDRVRVRCAAARVAAQQARRLVARVDAVAAPADQRALVGCGPEEQPALFNVAALPLLVLADAAALALVFLGVRLVLHELDVLAEWVEEVFRQPKQQRRVLDAAVLEAQRGAQNAADAGDGGEPPTRRRRTMQC